MVYGLIIFYSLFSLLSLHFILFSSLSPVLSHRFPLFSSHLVRFFFFFNLRSVWWWPLSPEAQAAQARFTSSPLTVATTREFAAHGAQAIVIADVQDEKGHRHCHDVIIIVITLQSRRSLSLFFGGWLFWLLLVGWFWLMVVGWSGCGCEIWDDLRSGYGLWEWDCVVGVRFMAM